MKPSNLLIVLIVLCSMTLGVMLSTLFAPQQILIHVTVPQTSIEDRDFKEIESLFADRVQAQERKIRRAWKPSSIKKASKMIQEISYTHGIHYTKLIAMLEHESSLYPYAISPVNTDGTRDYGLSQQNSKYSKQRFLRVFKEKFNMKKLHDYEVSLRMMGERLRECSKYMRENQKILCYNADANVKYNRKKYLNKVNEVLKKFKRQTEFSI